MKSRGGTLHHVEPEHAGKTLSAYLRSRLQGTSWAAIEKLVRSRHVTIHGNLCTDSARRLKTGDVVKVLDNAAASPPRPQDVRIVHLDDDVVVVDKPSGITTTRHHEEAAWPARRRQVQPTLDEMLPDVIGRFLASRSKRVQGAHGGTPLQPRSATGGKASRRPGPVRAVHRIDRETSGLVVFARTVPASRILAEQFRLHTTRRRYLALVVGRMETGTIISHLLRDRGDGRRGSSPEATGKRAVTHVRPVEHFGDDYTLVECRLETGRTHQIRIHMAESGHPVCGERVYAAPREAAVDDHSGARRVALHAAELGFVHPRSGEQMLFTADPPADLRALLARLRASAAARGRP